MLYFTTKNISDEGLPCKGLEEYSPDQLSAFLPQKVKCDAEIFLGNPMEQVVVTAPAYFDDNQHAATKDACGVLPLY